MTEKIQRRYLSDGPRDRRPPKIRPRVHGGHPPEVLQLFEQGLTLLKRVDGRLEHLLLAKFKFSQQLIRVDVGVGGRLAAGLQLIGLLQKVLKCFLYYWIATSQH